MALPENKIETPSIPKTEYSVYVYRHPLHREEDQNDWERKSTTVNIRKAMKYAEKFIGSGDYQKVEVKKKYFDSRSNRNLEMTVKIYEGDSITKPLSTEVLTAITILSTLAAFAAIFFALGSISK